jgi:hypothetical protein
VTVGLGPSRSRCHSDSDSGDSGVTVAGPVSDPGRAAAAAGPGVTVTGRRHPGRNGRPASVTVTVTVTESRESDSNRWHSDTVLVLAAWSP